MKAMPRREALRLFGLAGGGLLLGACTPVRAFMGWYPSEFRDDELVRRILESFTDAVVPGTGDPAELTRPLYDERFPLHSYLGYFASDLSRRARDACGNHRFDLLSRSERTRAIDAGLRADDTTMQLYSGAIFLVQVGFYAGIYDDEKGCPEIDFDGRFRPGSFSERTYARVKEFLGEEMGRDGNYT
jgi:hypothetical protein